MTDTLTPSEIEKLARWCGWEPDYAAHHKWWRRKERSVHQSRFTSPDFAFGEVWEKLIASGLCPNIEYADPALKDDKAGETNVHIHRITYRKLGGLDVRCIADVYAHTPTLALLRAALRVIERAGGE